MKKNIFNIFIDKLIEYPLWVKQVVFLKLYRNMRSFYCDRYIINHSDKLFSTYVPTVTFQGKTEMWNKMSGLDTNIYNFLTLCYEGYSILEISLNTFLSMEEVAKHCIFCIEQNYIEIPDSQEVFAMAGFIAGKFKTGEYYRVNGSITIDQLDYAIMEQRRLDDRREHKLFGKILVDLGFVTEQNVKTLFVLKNDARRRFILESDKMAKAQLPDQEKANYESEIEELKKENKALKQRLMHLLDLVKDKYD